MGVLPTAPLLVLSMLQSGMILESVTIQLLILSLRRRSTGWEGQRQGRQENEQENIRTLTDQRTASGSSVFLQ